MDKQDFNNLLFIIDSFNSDNTRLYILDEIFETISSNKMDNKQIDIVFKMLQQNTSYIFSYLNIERIENDEHLETVVIMVILDMLNKWMYQFKDCSRECRIEFEKSKLTELSKKIKIIIKVNSIFENKLYSDIDFFFIEFSKRVDRVYNQTIYRVL